LGAFAGPRIPERGAVTPAAAGQGRARPGCDRRRLGIRICPHRPQQHARSRAIACTARLVFEIRIEDGGERIRSRLGRRHGKAVSDRTRPGQAARLRHHSRHRDRSRPAGQPGNRRLGAGTGRSRVYRAGRRLSRVTGRLPSHPAADHGCWNRGAVGGCGTCPDRT